MSRVTEQPGLSNASPTALAPLPGFSKGLTRSQAEFPITSATRSAAQAAPANAADTAAAASARTAVRRPPWKLLAPIACSPFARRHSLYEDSPPPANGARHGAGGTRSRQVRDGRPRPHSASGRCASGRLLLVRGPRDKWATARNGDAGAGSTCPAYGTRTPGGACATLPASPSGRPPTDAVPLVGITGAIAGTGFALHRLIARDVAAMRADIRSGIGGLRADVANLRERMARLEGLFEGFARAAPPEVRTAAADRAPPPVCP